MGRTLLWALLAMALAAEDAVQPPFLDGFFPAVSMIIVSELGDKTFFIAAILAMKHDHLVIFAGCFAAVGAMNFLSAGIGYALPNLMPRSYTHWLSVLLFLGFGIKLLKESSEMTDEGENAEMIEVEEELQTYDTDIEAGSPQAKSRRYGSFLRFFPAIFIQAFTMTFAAEWGDRSQIATVALAARGNFWGVTLGGLVGHGVCTMLAVYGGKILAARISERSVSLVGGVLFLFFALHGLVSGP